MTSFEARFSTEHERHAFKRMGEDILTLEGYTSSRSGLAGKIHFQSRLHVQAVGGTVAVKHGVLSVRDADAATLRLVAATNYVNYRDISANPEKRCADYLAHALKSSFERQTGTKVAQEHYHCRGFVAHHNTDLWRGAAPVDTSIHGLWTMGGAWLSRHIFEHYGFSRNTEYLRAYYRPSGRPHSSLWII